MHRNRILPIALAASIITGAAGSYAFAKESGEAGHDTAALASAKVTLQQATATAEQQANGRALSADIEQERGVTQIEVKVAGPQGVKTVVVDAQSGQVTATHAGDQDGKDGGGEDQD